MGAVAPTDIKKIAFAPSDFMEKKVFVHLVFLKLSFLPSDFCCTNQIGNLNPNLHPEFLNPNDFLYTNIVDKAYYCVELVFGYLEARFLGWLVDGGHVKVIYARSG